MLLPIAAVARQFLNLLPQLAVLAVLLLVLQQTISISWLAVLPILILALLFASGLAMIAARLTVQVRDLSKLIPFVTRIVFYISGIFFSIERVLESVPALAPFIYLNPIYDFIELTRGALVVGHQMTGTLWLACSIWAMVTFVPGVIFFWIAEERYGNE
jgi:teichoic acid transport system permease protein